MVLSSKPAVAAVDRRDRQADERKYADRYTHTIEQIDFSQFLFGYDN